MIYDIFKQPWPHPHRTPLHDPRSAHEHPHPVRSAREGQSVEYRKGSAGEWRMAGGGRGQSPKIQLSQN
ncbi:MAG: hypothetical protein SCH39_13485 [Methanosarcinales archaeon]|nr:hypothetical protein [Methanosarcinales archaeon]